MVSHLTVEQRQLALRLKARGLSLWQIGPQVGCSHEMVRIIARGGPARPQRQIDPWVPGPGRPRSGASLRDLMARMGHDSERAAMIYQHEARGTDKRITEAIDSHVLAERARDDDDGAADGLAPVS